MSELTPEQVRALLPDEWQELWDARSTRSSNEFCLMRDLAQQVEATRQENKLRLEAEQLYANTFHELNQEKQRREAAETPSWVRERLPEWAVDAYADSMPCGAPDDDSGDPLVRDLCVALAKQVEATRQAETQRDQLAQLVSDLEDERVQERARREEAENNARTWSGDYKLLEAEHEKLKGRLARESERREAAEKERDEWKYWKSKAPKAAERLEAERDEWKRRCDAAEATVAWWATEFWPMAEAGQMNVESDLRAERDALAEKVAKQARTITRMKDGAELWRAELHSLVQLLDHCRQHLTREGDEILRSKIDAALEKYPATRRKT